MIEVHKKIKEAIETDRLVIFAGSGLSKKFNLPDWNALAIAIIDEIADENYFAFKQLLDVGLVTPIEVLEKLKSNHNIISGYIKKNFQIKGENPDLALHRKLLNLSGKIITTNYDNAFELASDNKIIPTIYSSKYNVSEINKNDADYIFKLHGCFSNPDDCILFKEQYEKLYSVDTAGKHKLSSIFTDKLILFIGFSFNDPDINLIFNTLDKAFGNNNEHYILTKEPEKFDNFNFIRTLSITDFNEIEKYVDRLVQYKEEIFTLKKPEAIEEVNRVNTIPNIAVLIPNPINENFSKEFENIVDCFSSFIVKIELGYLNLKTLETLFDYDLIVIASKVFKGQLYIEEDNLKSKLMSTSEIYQTIPNDEIPIVFITDEKIEYATGSNSVNISSLKSAIIKKFVFKALKEQKFDFKEIEISVHLSRIFDNQLEKGKSEIYSIYRNTKNLSIGKKSLTSVIGRVEEQSIIASKLISIMKSNKLLNVKASGGTGKTTLIKKVAYELYNRGYFEEGVVFKSCENIKSLDNFEELLIDGFNLSNILDFKGYLTENYSNEKLNSLIILDNFETVVNVLDKNELKETIDLLRFVTDYSNIVVTSRERISNSDDLEDIYSLTPLITEDAVILFQNEYGIIKNEIELKILREDILEDLLNNNPLAIKLVTNSRINFKHIIELRDQLKAHFFESTNEDYSSVFNNNADLNIERTKSIFQSINYSYTTLSTKEKIAFELLSLFPDGIGLANFKKCFFNKKSNNQISDTELRALKNKSLLEDYNGILQLQPIIRRFADYQFNKRSTDVKKKYCSDAYVFNCFVLNVIDFIEKKRTLSEALKAFTEYKNNFLEVLNYVSLIEISEDSKTPDKTYLLNYICSLEEYTVGDKQIQDLISKINKVANYFSDLPNASTLIEVITLKIVYYHQEFDNSYRELSKYLPVEDMKKRVFKEEEALERRYKDEVMHIHSMEGHTIELVSTHILNNNTGHYLDYDFFYLGIPDNISRKKQGFYKYEYDLMFNRLNLDDLEKYINSLYSEEHLEIMQSTYTLSKVKAVDKSAIQKLVVTNPYTKGLKNLMYAFVSNDRDEKKRFFEIALKNLIHIKFYYLEAFYYYCSYLKNIDDIEADNKIEEGLTYCNSCYYQYLSHKFINLKNSTFDDYLFDYNYYPITDFENYVKEHNAKWEKIFSDAEID